MTKVHAPQACAPQERAARRSPRTPTRERAVREPRPSTARNRQVSKGKDESAFPRAQRALSDCSPPPCACETQDCVSTTLFRKIWVRKLHCRNSHFKVVWPAIRGPLAEIPLFQALRCSCRVGKTESGKNKDGTPKKNKDNLRLAE